MSSSFAPDTFHKLISDIFLDSEHPAYGQVATVDANGHPHVRTVHIHFLPELEALAFNTHIQAAKWQHLSQNPFVEGCYVDAVRSVQLRFEAKVELIDPGNKKYSKLLTSLWLKMRTDVRKAYWLDYQSAPDIDINKHCPNLGTVICHPFIWKIYEINIENYLKGKNSFHELKNATWYSKVVSLIRGN